MPCAAAIQYRFWSKVSFANESRKEAEQVGSHGASGSPGWQWRFVRPVRTIGAQALLAAVERRRIVRLTRARLPREDRSRRRKHAVRGVRHDQIPAERRRGVAAPAEVAIREGVEVVAAAAGVVEAVGPVLDQHVAPAHTTTLS